MNQIVNNILNGYTVQDIDTAGATKYYGFLALDGRWIIQQEVTASGTYRYVSGGPQAGGSTNYQTAWTNRASQSFGYITGVS